MRRITFSSIAPGLQGEAVTSAFDGIAFRSERQQLFTGFKQAGFVAGLEEALKDRADAIGVARDSRRG
jgi:hypothetical protein